MKIVSGFILRNIVDSWVVVPVGKTSAEKSYMLSLSESSAFLWKKLEQGAEENELMDALIERYGIDADTAKRDVQSFLSELAAENLLI